MKHAREEATYVKLDVSQYDEIVLYADMDGADGNDHSVWADAKFTAAPLTPDESLDVEDGMILNPPATAGELKEAYTGQNVIVVDPKTGEALADDAALFTGAQVKFANASEYAPYQEVVVKGDVLGTGNPSIADLTAMKSHILSKDLLEGAYQVAADYNSDGVINIVDLVQDVNYILKIYQLI